MCDGSLVSHVDALISRGFKGGQFCYPIPSSLNISLTHNMQTNITIYIYIERESERERKRDKYIHCHMENR